MNNCFLGICKGAVISKRGGAVSCWLETILLYIIQYLFGSILSMSPILKYLNLADDKSFLLTSHKISVRYNLNPWSSIRGYSKRYNVAFPVLKKIDICNMYMA